MAQTGTAVRGQASADRADAAAKAGAADAADAPDTNRAALLWSEALEVAALLAVDPWRLGGVVLSAAQGPVREQWLTSLKSLLPQGSPWRRIPLHAGDDRLLGGLDLGATLAAGRPIAQTGLLAEADGGMVLLAMAERAPGSTVSRLCATLDTGECVLARDGLAARHPARFGVVALDESTGDDPPPAAALQERLAFRLDLASVPVGVAALFAGLDTAGEDAADPVALEAKQAVVAARARLDTVTIDDDTLAALCGTAAALGIESARAGLMAVRAARAAAALAGRSVVSAEDAALAARRVLAPRATRWPDPEPPEPAPEPPEPPPPPESTDPPPDDPESEPPPSPDSAQPLEEVVLEAARAAIPADLLATLMAAAGPVGGGAGGRVGAVRTSTLRGRPMGARPGRPRDGTRLALVDTLRAAAPWQPLRRREALARAAAATQSPTPPPRMALRTEDLRVSRLRERTETTTVFVIDASGSAALHRLAEAKGAIELLLADCYVRRDRVAVIAFRGRSAEVLLPPTRSLVRAKRSLAGLPGGGGTPLASAIDTAAGLVDGVARRGGSPVVVFLTDGRANVARDGSGGRAQADADAQDAARRMRLAGRAAVLVLDTSPQPAPSAHSLALNLGARYVPLPRADSAAIAAPVRAASTAARTPRGPVR